VHDLVLLRQGLRRLLDDEPDVEVVAEAGSAAEALKEIFEHRPEVVIGDAQIFHCAADQAEQLILQQSPDSTVLFLTTGEEDDLRGAEPVEGTQVAVRRTSADELVTMVRKTAVDRARE
jgi:two-component system nitrate/nitrite response regulator NarL